MISIRQELSNYKAINLDDYAETQVPENVRNSIQLYNKALESIKNDSEDMAVIELKKAVSMNPDFPEAMNLLGLCYIGMKDYAKASSIFEQVAAKENNGVAAVKYLNAINSNDQNITSVAKRKNSPQINEQGNPFIKDIVNIRYNWKRDALKYVLGLIAGILAFIIVQSVFLTGGDNSRAVSKDADSTLAEQTGDQVPSAKRYDDLKKERDKLKSDLDAAGKEVSYYQNISKLNDIQGLYSQRKYEEAADLLVLLKSTEFKEADKQKFNELYKEIMPRALQLVMGDGARLFSSGKFQEAIQKLNKVLLYDDKWESIDRVYYYIGKSYFKLNDSKNALDALNKVVMNYPNSIYAAYSKNYINQLNSNTSN